MYRKTYYATHPGSIHGATNEDLRERYLMGDILPPTRFDLTIRTMNGW